MTENKEKIKYVCPMGCVKPQDYPGKCPMCGMDLISQKIKEENNHNDHRQNKNHNEKEFSKHAGHRAEDFLKKFWLSLILTLPIVFYSDIFGRLTKIQLPTFAGLDFVILILASIIFFYGGWVFILGALREIRAKNPGMMTLIALAISAAYFYSTSTFIFKFGHEFFWELSTLIVIMLLGHYFEMKSVSEAQSSLKEIEKLLPDSAERIKINNEIETISLNQIQKDDILLIRPGSKIPADGIIIEGSSEINESMITGESKPVIKNIGDEVIAGTINGDGMLKIKVLKIGEETFLAGIKRLILEAQKSKSRLQILADVFAKYLTFIAIGVGFLSFIFWLLIQKDFSIALERLVTVLVISCPHALGLAVPLVVAISTTLAIRNGFLIKNRIQLELSRKIDIVLFDKTGTLTKGQFKIKSIKVLKELSEEKALQIAASLSQYSNNFISQGILKEAKVKNIAPLEVKDFKNLTGRGVSGKIENNSYYLGGENLLKKLKINFQLNEVKTTNYLIDENKNILAVLVLEDEIREESKKAILELHKLGIKSAMITGDKNGVAEKVAKELEIDEYFAEVLPQDKVLKVKELQEKGLKVMMVGDGINDAPALAQADVGVAIGAGTNVAIESAGIILVKNNPLDVLKIIKLSRFTFKKMVQNLIWATGYNVFAIPLAAGVLAWKGIVLGPALAAALMSLSTIIVAINAVLMKKVEFNF